MLGVRGEAGYPCPPRPTLQSSLSQGISPCISKEKPIPTCPTERTQAVPFLSAKGLTEWGGHDPLAEGA